MHVNMDVDMDVHVNMDLDKDVKLRVGLGGGMDVVGMGMENGMGLVMEIVVQLYIRYHLILVHYE